MRFTRTSKALGMVAIAALALTGCGAGGGSNDGASQSAGDPNKVITAYSNEPQNPLLPANTNEVYGGRVVELLFEGLRSYDPDGKPVNALAESIESPDAQNWTIKVKQGHKFTNGEAITAKTLRGLLELRRATPRTCRTTASSSNPSQAMTMSRL